MHALNSPPPSSTMLPSTPLPPPILPRRSLHYIPLNKSPPTTTPTKSMPGTGGPTMSSFDANTIAIIAALVCSVIVGLILNFIVRLTLQLAKQMWSDTEPHEVNQLNQFGVKRNALRALPTLVYSANLGLPGPSPECIICLSGFVPGERVRVLPKCSHGFHASCIDQWLTDHSSCPTCRQCSFSRSQLVVGCTEAEDGPEQLVRLPMDLEDLIEDYRVCC